MDYTYEIPEKLESFSYEELDTKALNGLKVGDYVAISVSFPTNEFKKGRYVCITEIDEVQNTIKGYIHDYQLYNEHVLTCNVCMQEQSRKVICKDPEQLFYSCKGIYESRPSDTSDEWCDFHCHYKCLSKIEELTGSKKKFCDCTLKEIPFQNNKEIEFDRKYIYRITDWSKNGRKLCAENQLLPHK